LKEKNKMANITGKFNWKTSEVVPAFVEGEDAKAIFEASNYLAL